LADLKVVLAEEARRTTAAAMLAHIRVALSRGHGIRALWKEPQIAVLPLK
jgi:hypothetical protein